MLDDIVRIREKKEGFIVRVGNDTSKPFFVFKTLDDLFDFLKEHYARGKKK